MNSVMRSTSAALAMLCLLCGVNRGAHAAKPSALVLFGPVVPAPWLVTDDCPEELLDNSWIVAPGSNLPPAAEPEAALRSETRTVQEETSVVTAEGTAPTTEVTQTRHVAPTLAEIEEISEEPTNTPSPLVLFPPEPADWLVVSPYANEITAGSGQAWLALAKPVTDRNFLAHQPDSVAHVMHQTQVGQENPGGVETAYASVEATTDTKSAAGPGGPTGEQIAAPGLIAPASLQVSGMTPTGQLAFASDCVCNPAGGRNAGHSLTQACCFEMRFLLSEPELAPLEAISPQLRRRAYEKNPYQQVLTYEAMPNLSLQAGPRCETNVEYRAAVPKLNQVHLKNDVPVAQMRLSTAPEPGRMPEDRSSVKEAERALVHVPGTTRGWCPQQMHWNASEATHAPLYFEDIALERSGYSRGYLQPFVSGVKFFTTVPLLPGLMTIDPPLSTEYALGEVEPGSIVPYTAREPEWTYKAIAVEAGAVLGLAFLIP